MELPKNITQIGESDRFCKIYAEDYVISYMKQLNQYARDKDMAVALYGVRKEEAGITYLFFYGACKLNFLQRECRHLSQAQLQEIEKMRRKHFSEYVFLGYRLLNGEMVDGFHIYEQGVCRYITGYAQFYEKNDSMLAFMLKERQEEKKPEEVDQEKYEAVKKRQEERRAQVIPYRAGKKKAQEAGMRRAKLTAAGVFVLLCAAGLAALGSGGKLEELQVAARQMIEEMSEQQLPDALPAGADSAVVGTIVAEDKLTEAIQKENAEASVSTAQASETSGTEETENASQQPSDTGQAGEAENASQQPSGTGQTGEAENASQQASGTGQAGEDGTPAEPTPEPTPTPVPTPEPTPAPVSYTIKRGDTLIGICIRQYGTDERVSEICTLNGIEDADDIKVGQKILLP